VGYLSNTDSDRAEMLEAIGVGSFDELLAPIPKSIRLKSDLNLPG
jgi:glycine dehydrogenase subunit 1